MTLPPIVHLLNVIIFYEKQCKLISQNKIQIMYNKLLYMINNQIQNE